MARPLIIIPPGLKEWFRREACPEEGVVLFAELREVDPTVPGLPEFEEAISADAGPDFVPQTQTPPTEQAAAQAKLRLVVFPGQKRTP